MVVPALPNKAIESAPVRAHENERNSYQPSVAGDSQLASMMTDRHRIYGYEECRDAAIDAFFTSISEELEEFARQHHLTIWKYPGRGPMWVFHFLHPAGGFGSVQLYCVRELKTRDGLRVSISGNWYVDDHEKRLRRHYPHAETWEVQPISEEILPSLARQLDRIVRCPPEDLVPTQYTYVPTGDGQGNELVSDFELGLRVPV